jgi:hypothetical protein
LIDVTAVAFVTTFAMSRQLGGVLGAAAPFATACRR